MNQQMQNIMKNGIVQMTTNPNRVFRSMREAAQIAGASETEIRRHIRRQLEQHKRRQMAQG